MCLVSGVVFKNMLKFKQTEPGGNPGSDQRRQIPLCLIAEVFNLRRYFKKSMTDHLQCQLHVFDYSHARQNLPGKKTFRNLA